MLLWPPAASWARPWQNKQKLFLNNRLLTKSDTHLLTLTQFYPFYPHCSSPFSFYSPLSLPPFCIHPFDTFSYSLKPQSNYSPLFSITLTEKAACVGNRQLFLFPKAAIANQSSDWCDNPYLAPCVKGAVERMRDWGIVVHQTTLPSTLRVATSPYTGEALVTDFLLRCPKFCSGI